MTGLEVGPDGALYFCTGGRGTEGGIYRIVWRGRVPPEVTNLGEGIQQAIRQPQLDSAFARQKIAMVKQSLGTAWDAQLTAVADSPTATAMDRCRALDLMHLFGPFPNTAQLVRLASDQDTQVRAKATYMMGLHADSTTRAKLVQLLRDRDPQVQRTACEALVRAAQKPKYDELAPLLASKDRYVAYRRHAIVGNLALRGISSGPLESEKQSRVRAGGAGAVDYGSRSGNVPGNHRPRRRPSWMVLSAIPIFSICCERCSLALARGEIKPTEVPQLSEKIAREFPTRNSQMNRELIRLVAYLQGYSAAHRMIEQLAADIPKDDKLQIALYARFLNGWSTQQKLDLLKFFEAARAQTGGHSFEGYIDNVSRDFFAGLTDQERAVGLGRRREVAQFSSGRNCQAAGRSVCGNHRSNYRARQTNVRRRRGARAKTGDRRRGRVGPFAQSAGQ